MILIAGFSVYRVRTLRARAAGLRDAVPQRGAQAAALELGPARCVWAPPAEPPLEAELGSGSDGRWAPEMWHVRCECIARRSAPRALAPLSLSLSLFLFGYITVISKFWAVPRCIFHSPSRHGHQCVLHSRPRNFDAQASSQQGRGGCRDRSELKNRIEHCNRQRHLIRNV